MQQERIEPLVEAIYDASLDPAGWARAMALVRESFETGAACLYSLDYQRRRMRPVEVGHIAPRFLGSFEAKIGRAPSELQSLMRISYAGLCLKKKTSTSAIQ